VEQTVQWIAAPLLTLVGLTQLYRVDWWLDRHQRFANGGPPAIRVYGLAVLAAGGVVVFLHNVWSGPAVVLTLLGYLLVLEGGVALVVPQIGLAGLARAEPEMRRNAVVATGVISLTVAGVLWVHLLLVG